MRSTPDEVARDPLFQLNSLLWLAQPLPHGSQITPLLHTRGFRVYAIAPLLALPPDLRLAVQQAGLAVQQGARPDVVLAKEDEGKFALTECKGRSFGPDSSSAEQARVLLLFTGARAAEVLALDPTQVRDARLVVLIPEKEAALLRPTLEALRSELEQEALPVGEFLELGLEVTSTEVRLLIDAQASGFFGLPEGPAAFLKREPDTDPRPLYFIPFDPDLQQEEEEKVFCKRILFERMQSTVVAAVGRATPPADLVLKRNKMLNDATFGMFDHWENRDSGRHMRRLCREFMGAVAEAVESVAPGSLIYEPGQGWLVRLTDDEVHDSVIDALGRFSCETLDLREEPLPGLFDDLEIEGRGGGQP